MGYDVGYPTGPLMVDPSPGLSRVMSASHARLQHDDPSALSYHNTRSERITHHTRVPSDGYTLSSRGREVRGLVEAGFFCAFPEGA